MEPKVVNRISYGGDYLYKTMPLAWDETKLILAKSGIRRMKRGEGGETTTIVTVREPYSEIIEKLKKDGWSYDVVTPPQRWGGQEGGLSKGPFRLAVTGDEKECGVTCTSKNAEPLKYSATAKVMNTKTQKILAEAEKIIKQAKKVVSKEDPDNIKALSKQTSLYRICNGTYDWEGKYQVIKSTTQTRIDKNGNASGNYLQVAGPFKTIEEAAEKAAALNKDPEFNKIFSF